MEIHSRDDFKKWVMAFLSKINNYLGAVAIIEAAGGRVSEYLVADGLQTVALICGFHFKEEVSQASPGSGKPRHYGPSRAFQQIGDLLI